MITIFASELKWLFKIFKPQEAAKQANTKWETTKSYCINIVYWLVCFRILSFFIQSMTGGCPERHNQFTAGWGGEAKKKKKKYFRPKLKSDKNTALFQHSKEIRYFFSVLKTTARSSILRHLILPLRGNQQKKQTISLYQPNSNSFGNYTCCLTLLVSKCVWKLWVLIIDFLYSIEIIFNIR